MVFLLILTGRAMELLLEPKLPSSIQPLVRQGTLIRRIMFFWQLDVKMVTRRMQPEYIVPLGAYADKIRILLRLPSLTTTCTRTRIS